MGNTGVALARDGSAPFLDPATIATIENGRFAFSMHLFTYSIRHFSSWNEPGPVDTSKFGDVTLQPNGSTATRFSALPSTLCLFFTIADPSPDEKAEAAPPRGRQKLAVCLGSLESDNVNLTALSFHGSTAAGTTTELESIARSWNRLYVGPSYAIEITDRIALGASLQGVVTSDSFVVSGTSITSLAGGSAINSALGTSGYGWSFDLAATLGATYRVGSFTFGASAQLPALHALSRFQASANDSNTGTDESSTLQSGTGSLRAPPPARVAAGVGVQWPALTLELDESYDVPSSDAISSNMQVTSTTLANGAVTATSFPAHFAIGTQSSFNTALGAEYFVTRGFSLLGGASTNFSTLRGLAPSTSLGNLVQSRTSYVGLSFGIGSYGGAGDVLLGVQVQYGWGDALVGNPYVVPNQWAVVENQLYSALFVLAGDTDLRVIGRVAEKVKNAVTTGVPDNAPKPPPLSP